ncbi:IgGFc-binding protein-like [Amphiura filiformis]|uniref:IgGFc-binding protein-like n=1 Tax=Amphiura filiformis TaxID=82378 RepID=UPI003B210528
MSLENLFCIYVGYLLTAYSCCKAAKGFDEEYEFVFGIPKTYDPNIPHVLLSTSSPDPVNATVTIPGTDFYEERSVTRTTYVDVALPNSVYLTGNGTDNNKTVVVRSSAKVSVHVMVNNGRSGDGFLVLPTSQLGVDHYVLSYTPYLWGSNYPSFICVSATGKRSFVRIRTVSGRTYDVALQRYESYQLIGNLGEDLSGSRIISDHAVAVIAGTQCSYIDDGGCDALVEQMLPVQLWGTRVVLSPFAGKDNGYIYRVLGSNRTTEAIISDIGMVTLTEGKWYEGNMTDAAIVTIDSDFPIFVMQYIKGGGSTMPRADTSMIIAPSRNIYTNIVTFPVYEVAVSTNKYFIHMIVNCNQVKGVTFDKNNSIASWELLATSDGDICSARREITAGSVHSISLEDENVTFTVAVYGLVEDGHKSSYAYLADIQNVENSPAAEKPPTSIATLTEFSSLTCCTICSVLLLFLLYT